MMTKAMLAIGAGLLLLLISNCAQLDHTRRDHQDLTRLPIQATNEFELKNALALLNEQLSPTQTEHIRDAMGVLFVTNLRYRTRDQFIAAAIDGRSPTELIELAGEKKIQYGIVD